MNSIQPAVAELERAFVEFVPLFQREMPLPCITIQTKAKASHRLVRRTQVGEQRPGPVPEINISAEHLARPPQDIAETLIHEMVHYANHLDGIRDCTVRQYHNLNFKKPSRGSRPGRREAFFPRLGDDQAVGRLLLKVNDTRHQPGCVQPLSDWDPSTSPPAPD